MGVGTGVQTGPECSCADPPPHPTAPAPALATQAATACGHQSWALDSNALLARVMTDTQSRQPDARWSRGWA